MAPVLVGPPSSLQEKDPLRRESGIGGSDLELDDKRLECDRNMYLVVQRVHGYLGRERERLMKNEDRNKCCCCSGNTWLPRDRKRE